MKLFEAEEVREARDSSDLRSSQVTVAPEAYSE